jgi:transposase-like protein
LTLAEIRKRVESEADAYMLLEELRWPNGPVCPHCGYDKAYFLKPTNGISRATGPNRVLSQRRVWKCAKCRKQFSVLTGTIFHGTKVSIEVWLMVMVQMCSAKNGISAREIERMHGLTPETAWYVLHRLREAMKREPLIGMLRGTIAADETIIGGSTKNMHRSKLEPAGAKNGHHMDNKTTVLSLINKTTGEVRSAVVPDVSGPTLRKAIAEQVDMAGSHLETDGWTPYLSVGEEFASHESVSHADGEYVRGSVTTNHVEGYFAQLKRSIDGTHHHVSKTHLPRYLAEFDFRYSTCKLTDSERLQRMVNQAQGRRLSYKPLRDR